MSWRLKKGIRGQDLGEVFHGGVASGSVSPVPGGPSEGSSRRGSRNSESMGSSDGIFDALSGHGDGHSVLRELKPAKMLNVMCVVLKVGWAGNGKLAVEATGIRGEVSPPPVCGLPPLLELPSLR